MCEKCANPEIVHLSDEKGIKPFQKKLSVSSLKTKVKKTKSVDTSTTE